jgi:flagellar hook-associated protein 2
MGETVAVSTGSGNLNLTLGAGLRIGDASVAVVSTGDRSLSAVTDAINGAGVGVTAAAVNAAPNQWFLQLNSSATGTSRAIATDPNAFAPAGGTINTSVASDAKITIGNGPGAYSIVASGNTFANVLPGVSFTATQQSATPVTVSVNRDDSATASAIDALVGQANDLIKAVGDQTRYDAANRIVAPLADNSTVRGLADQVRSAITSLVGGMSGSSVTTAADIGINVQRDGTIKFDKSVFLAKAAADPDAVDKLFSRHATVPTGLTFAGASDSTVPGSYAVNITQAATRATTGEVVVGGSVAGQTIGVRVGTTIATYAAAAGATASQIVSGLNDAIARAGLKVTAELTSGGGVKLTSGQFGGGGSFDTNLDTTGAGSWATNTGTDVVGTINGTNAIGVGNHLYLLDLGTSPARGLKIDVGEGVTGAVGNIGYQPGIAARLVNLGTGLTGLLGPLTTAASSFDQKVTDFNKQIDDFNARLVIKEANLRRQWTAVQTALTSLQNQQSWLTQQTATKSG